MIFTGSQTIVKRNFYTQTGNFGVGINCLVDSTTGVYHFGISGAQGVFDFALLSGQLYQGGTLVHAYQLNRTFGVEVQFASGSYNIFKDTQPMVFGLPKPTGAYDYFYFARSSSGINAEFDIWISGDSSPRQTITEQGYLTTSGQAGVTGYITNNGVYPIRIFAASALNPQDLSFGLLASNIAGGGTGAFAYSGDFDGFNFNTPILTTFNANYGDSTINFLITDLRSYNVFVLLGPIPTYTLTDGALNQDLSYTNYSGGFQTNSFDASLTFSLEYISGSGSFVTAEFAESASYLTTGYGNFRQSGLLTGIATIVTGDDASTGTYVVLPTQFAWAIGAATGRFSFWGNGLASGIGYTGMASALFTGIATGLIYNGSGTLQLNQIFSGVATGTVLSTDYPQYVNATGYVNVSGLQNDDILYIGVESSPLIKGFQFVNATGLSYYLSGTSQHKVSSYVSNDVVYLQSLFSGTLGNGIFVRTGNCNMGTALLSPWLTGGQNIGTTGNVVVPIGSFSGYGSLNLTGSGSYSAPLSGTMSGLFYYTKTFTGSWDLLTGASSTSLVSLKRPGNYSPTMISGSGNFPPNSFVNFQIENPSDGINVSSARLRISGNRVANAINQVITN